jgi:general stress protein YciG
MSAAFSHTQPQFTTPENQTGQTGTQSPAAPETHELAPDRQPAPPSERLVATSDPDAPAKPRRPRGFAAMDRKLVSEIARKGGKAAHSAGTAHEFTADEAREAGRKGGRATHAKRRAVGGGSDGESGGEQG